MYMIWKIRCKRTITWQNDPTKTHSEYEIHNKWLQTINTWLKMDSIQTNTKIFKKKSIDPKIVLKTWKRCLKDDLLNTNNWCGKTGVLVGIAPKRPPGRNRWAHRHHPKRVPHTVNNQCVSAFPPGVIQRYYISLLTKLWA
jgi:hypothetical protein